MHAVVVRVSISDVESAEAALQNEVVPRASGAPGFVAGYWTRKDNGGLSMIVYESEENAQAVAGMIPSGMPEGVTLDDVEVREVVANA